MRPGRAPIADAGLESTRHPWNRRWPPRRGARIGLVAFLTVFCWGVWIHLVLPLAGLVLWWLGVGRLVEQVFTVAYEDLSATLLSYTGVFLVMSSLLGVWILWNLFCYGGTVRPDETPDLVADSKVRRVFEVGRDELALLRGGRVVHVDLDRDDRVRVLDRPGGAVAMVPLSSHRASREAQSVIASSRSTLR
ncbi:MAG TPA: poly-beta-1,6-N-acetyl-D-glucosamine biosynthesis protein PgaD [Thermoanaerobaculia bacterium]